MATKSYDHRGTPFREYKAACADALVTIRIYPRNTFISYCPPTDPDGYTAEDAAAGFQGIGWRKIPNEEFNRRRKFILAELRHHLDIVCGGLRCEECRQYEQKKENNRENTNPPMDR